MRTIKTNLERQLFTDGVMNVYEIKNVAEKGMLARYDKVLIQSDVPYANKTAGEKRRFYAAREGKEFDRVLRVQMEWGISTEHVIEIDKQLYKVVSNNNIYAVFPPFTEITLRKVANISECIA